MAAIYRYCREDRPFLGQGRRFGLAAAVSVIAGYLIGYVVTNIPAALAIKQIALVWRFSSSPTHHAEGVSSKPSCQTLGRGNRLGSTPSMFRYSGVERRK